MTTADAAGLAFSNRPKGAEPGLPPWEDDRQDGAPAQGPASAGQAGLSPDFIGRLLEFVAWQPGWDGDAAERVEPSTARRAAEIARDMLPVAAEPFVAPAPGGSLLLQWDLAGGTSVEVYADGEPAFPEWAALTRQGVVHEVRLDGPGALRSLLGRREPMPPARQ